MTRRACIKALGLVMAGVATRMVPFLPRPLQPYVPALDPTRFAGFEMKDFSATFELSWDFLRKNDQDAAWRLGSYRGDRLKLLQIVASPPESHPDLFSEVV